MFVSKESKKLDNTNECVLKHILEKRNKNSVEGGEFIFVLKIKLKTMKRGMQILSENILSKFRICDGVG